MHLSFPGPFFLLSLRPHATSSAFVPSPGPFKMPPSVDILTPLLSLRPSSISTAGLFQLPSPKLYACHRSSPPKPFFNRWPVLFLGVLLKQHSPLRFSPGPPSLCLFCKGNPCSPPKSPLLFDRGIGLATLTNHNSKYFLPTLFVFLRLCYSSLLFVPG